MNYVTSLQRDGIFFLRECQVFYKDCPNLRQEFNVFDDNGFLYGSRGFYYGV